MISFEPLVGGSGSLPGTPAAYLLSVDQVNILLDCGAPDWASSDSSAYIDALSKIAPSIDLVLLSHGDLAHTGLYPYARAHWNLLAPAYATLPVQSLARISATEESQSFSAERATEGTCIATSAEIANAFESVNSVGYSEPTHLQGKCTGLTITPFGAGHSLGGTIWKIRSPSSGTLIYGVDLNHTKERCLDGTVLLKSGGQGSGLEVFEPLARPDVFITDASRILVTSARRTDREKAFLQNITDTLTDHHSVLIPSDLDSRLLEMLILLDHHWSFSKMRYPLCLVSRNGEAYLKETIPSLMEWFGGVVGAGVASDSVGDDTGRRRHEHETLLKFRNLEFFARPEHLIKKYSSRDPKVIIAVPFSMSYGPARKIFVENGIGEGHGNLVLLTRQDQSESWASNLIRRWSDEQPATTDSIGTMIPLEEQQTLKMHSKTPLTGVELEEHLAAIKATQEREAATAAMLERERRRLEAEAEEDSDLESDYSGSEGDDDPMAGQDPSMVVAEPGGGSRPRRRKDVDADSTPVAHSFLTYELDAKKSYDIYIKGSSSRTSEFFKAGLSVGKERERHRLFPFVERRRAPATDGFGERIDVSGWLRKGKEITSREEDEEQKQVQKQEEKDEVIEVPSKNVIQDFDLNLACNVLYVDLAGLNDGRAVKTILPRLNPRKLIVVRATASASDHLRDVCNNIRSMTSEILCPREREKLQIGHYTQNFAISLSEELVSSIKMSSFEDNDVGYIVGKVDNHVSSSIPILRPLAAPKIETDSQESQEGGNEFLKALPQTTLIGDLRLTTLKTQLVKLGLSAEFAGEGVLVCSTGKAKGNDVMDVDTDVVAVRKRGKERLLVEGAPSDVY